MATSVAACSVPARWDSTPSTDAAEEPRTDVPLDETAACVDSSTTCSDGGLVTCGADGRVEIVPCASTAETCVQGLGCASCWPGRRRCAANSDRVELCDADGRTWITLATCSGPGLGCVDGQCESLCSPTAGVARSRGCDFSTATLLSAATTFPDASRYSFRIVLLNGGTMSAEVRTTGAADWDRTPITIASGGSASLQIPWNLTLSTAGRRSVVAENAAIRLHSDRPLAAIVFNPPERLGDASLLLPQPMWGSSYVALTYDPGSFNAFLAVILAPGMDPDADVRFEMSTPVFPGTTLTGRSGTIRMNRDAVIQLAADGSMPFLSGSRVTAQSSIVAFSGSPSVCIPDGAVGSCGRLEEQLIPTDRWRNRAIVSRFMYEGAVFPETFARVLALNDATAIDVVPRDIYAGPRVLNAGESVTIPATRDFLVAGSGPLSVMQFQRGMRADPSPGDSSMATALAPEQFCVRAGFYSPDGYSNYANVVFERGAHVRLDGQFVATDDGRTVEGTPWRVVTTRVSPGVHSVDEFSGARVGVLVYGVGSIAAYSYPGCVSD